VLEDRVLVTIRDPGLLMAFSLGEMRELGRAELPADAWGLAVSRDGKRAFVTSAWAAEVSSVELDAMKPLWSVKVAREPRGITVTEDGRAVYVSHLVGSNLTKITIDGPGPKVATVALPPDPLRSVAGDVTVRASLGYALLLTEDGQRLFAARHALGALWSWQGNPTVDGLVVATDEPLAPTRGGRALGQLTLEELKSPGDWDLSGGIAGSSHARWVQPRAMVMRTRTHQLLVASEGASELMEVPSGRPPWQPDFARAAPVPADPTPAPTKEEWASAPEAADVRVSDPGCAAKRLREWVRVECKEVVGFERVTGPLDDASFGCFNEAPASQNFLHCERAWVVFALRRGQRRAFQSFRPTKWSSTPDTLVSGQFLAKDPTPLVTVQGIRGGI
jgi:hypothetical protein